MSARAFLYDMIYALAAQGGREAALFGQCAPRAHEAFCRSLAGSGFPELWFEVPMVGEPWFDLHALIARENVDEDAQPPQGCSDAARSAFDWFKTTRSTRQLAYSWDIGTAEAQEPAVQLLLYRPDMQEACAFLEAAGRPDAQDAYRSFVERIPQSWFACYAGVFPARRTPFLRVECVFERDQSAAYAADAGILREHLAQVGLDRVSDDAIELCRYLAGLPLQMEFQFDVDADGYATDTFSASVRFAQPPGTDAHESFDAEGAAGALMRQLEERGLADSRWELLPDTFFAQGIRLGGQNLGTAYCYPAFIKIRWREGALLDAKSYLIAGLE